MVNELDKADNAFIKYATLSGAAKNEKSLPRSMYNGAPGGCPTSSLYAAVMYSPQSHRLAVSSIVKRYTSEAIANTTQPVILLMKV